MAKKKVTKKQSVKDRVDKLDERIPVLVKKYPVVFGVVCGGGFLIGLVVGAMVF